MPTDVSEEDVVNPDREVVVGSEVVGGGVVVGSKVVLGGEEVVIMGKGSYGGPSELSLKEWCEPTTPPPTTAATIIRRTTTIPIFPSLVQHHGVRMSMGEGSFLDSSLTTELTAPGLELGAAPYAPMLRC